jgi:hypothetical protein
VNLRALGRPLLAVAAVGATLLAAELVARTAFGPPRYHSEPLELDPQLGFRGIPNYRSRSSDAEGVAFAFALNGQGLRGREIPAQPPADDVMRIAFVGDSFLVGQGVPEDALLPIRVGHTLAARGMRNEVYNLSAADYGTGQELLLLRRFGRRLAPRVVVLAVFPQNDLVNNFEGLANRTRVSPGDSLRPYLTPSGESWRVHYTQPFRAVLRRHSRLYAGLEHRLLTSTSPWGASWLASRTPPTPPEERLAAGLAPLERLELFRSHEPDQPWAQAWRRTRRLIAAFRDECDALSARLLVLVIPDLHQVQRSARDRGVEVYLPDRHLNARGHALAAEAIAAALSASDRAALRAPVGGPVRLPRGARAPRAIEPGNPAHWLYRSQDWIPWKPEEKVGGALSLDGALLAVPASGRELVVRGIAAARHYPLAVELAFAGGPRQSFRIERPGPFVLRLALPRAELPTSDGYTALRFHPSGDTAPETSTGLIVREVGFAP